MNYQVPPLACESNICYFCDYQLTKRESEDKKNSKVKKTSNTSTTNQNSSDNGQASQSGQITGQSRKKSFYLQKSIKSQCSDILATSVNATIIKKVRKQDNKDLSQVEYFLYYKKDYYVNKCSNKEI